MDWDTFYFEHWVEDHEPGDEPTHEDYIDWLNDKAQDARDQMKHYEMMQEVGQ